MANDTPASLKSEISKEVITVHSQNLEKLSVDISSKYQVKTTIVDNSIRIETDNSSAILASILSDHNGVIDSIASNKSNLEDVFYHKTGKRLS